MIQLNLQTLRYRGGAVRPDCGNIRFYDSNMNAMYSWLESISNNIATFWLKVATAIPANGAATVFMIPQSYGTTFDGVYAGQAPQLSATYGQYDNGASVFPFYDNFAGTAINSEWTQVIPSGASISQNNGITISTSTANYGGLILTSGFTGIQIFEGDVTAVSGVAAGFSLANGNAPANYGMTFTFWSGSVSHMSMSGGAEVYTGPNLQISTGIMSGVLLSSTSQAWYKNYAATDGTYSFTLPSTIYPNIGIFANSLSTSITYQWVRTRAYPPNGVMPFILISQWQSGGE